MIISNLMKIWQKEKLLVTSNFSFSLNVFKRLLQQTHKNPGRFGKRLTEKILKHLTHYQTTNFRLFQTERVCRRQFQIWRKRKKVIQTVENTVGKGEIACFQKACFPGSSTVVIVWEWVKSNLPPKLVI